ncbi:MAG TPA: hypothetical protein VGW34_13035 [Allosphingosinicella sp.]|nr:hypothetical protein [Allosphingosinicella sp.]
MMSMLRDFLGQAIGHGLRWLLILFLSAYSARWLINNVTGLYLIICLLLWLIIVVGLIFFSGKFVEFILNGSKAGDDPETSPGDSRRSQEQKDRP